jgi:hypothetical protein
MEALMRRLVPFGPLGQGIEAHGSQMPGQHPRGFGPGRMGGAVLAQDAGLGVVHALVEGEVALDGLHHLQQGDLVGRPGQTHPAPGAPGGQDQPPFDQLAHQTADKGNREQPQPGNLADGHLGSRLKAGQVQYQTGGVIGLP